MTESTTDTCVLPISSTTVNSPLHRAAIAWKRVMLILEYAHLADFLLHAGHSDVVALLIFVLQWPAGWLVLGWLMALYFYLESRGAGPR